MATTPSPWTLQEALHRELPTRGQGPPSAISFALARSFCKVLAVNAMSQEDRIYEPLLKIFKTACMRSLLAGEFLVMTSLCKAFSKVRAVVARKQEC